MQFRRAWLFICLLFGSLLACQQNLAVPDDATLVYYGPVTTSTQIGGMLPMDQEDLNRQVYVYDDNLGKIVAVRTVDGQHRDVNFQWVQGHRYRIYFY